MSEVQAPPPKWVIASKENQGAVTEDAQQKATNKRFPQEHAIHVILPFSTEILTEESFS